MKKIQQVNDQYVLRYVQQVMPSDVYLVQYRYKEGEDVTWHTGIIAEIMVSQRFVQDAVLPEVIVAGLWETQISDPVTRQTLSRLVVEHLTT